MLMRVSLGGLVYGFNWNQLSSFGWYAATGRRCITETPAPVFATPIARPTSISFDTCSLTKSTSSYVSRVDDNSVSRLTIRSARLTGVSIKVGALSRKAEKRTRT